MCPVCLVAAALKEAESACVDNRNITWKRWRVLKHLFPLEATNHFSSAVIFIITLSADSLAQLILLVQSWQKIVKTTQFPRSKVMTLNVWIKP